MSQVLSLRIPDAVAERLDRFARRRGNGMTRARAGLLLIEESLREAEFAQIEFRDTILGRQPFMKASGLAVWEVVMMAKRYDLDAARMANDFPYPVDHIRGALNYYEAFHEELDQAIADNEIGSESLKRQLPGLHVFNVAQQEGHGAS